MKGRQQGRGPNARGRGPRPGAQARAPINEAWLRSHRRRNAARASPRRPRPSPLATVNAAIAAVLSRSGPATNGTALVNMLSRTPAAALPYMSTRSRRAVFSSFGVPSRRIPFALMLLSMIIGVAGGRPASQTEVNVLSDIIVSQNDADIAASVQWGAANTTSTIRNSAEILLNRALDRAANLNSNSAQPPAVPAPMAPPNSAPGNVALAVYTAVAGAVTAGAATAMAVAGKCPQAEAAHNASMNGLMAIEKSILSEVFTFRNRGFRETPKAYNNAKAAAKTNFNRSVSERLAQIRSNRMAQVIAYKDVCTEESNAAVSRIQDATKQTANSGMAVAARIHSAENVIKAERAVITAEGESRTQNIEERAKTAAATQAALREEIQSKVNANKSVRAARSKASVASAEAEEAKAARAAAAEAAKGAQQLARKARANANSTGHKTKANALAAQRKAATLEREARAAAAASDAAATAERRAAEQAARALTASKTAEARAAEAAEREALETRRQAAKVAGREAFEAAGGALAVTKMGFNAVTTLGLATIGVAIIAATIFAVGTLVAVKGQAAVLDTFKSIVSRIYNRIYSLTPSKETSLATIFGLVVMGVSWRSGAGVKWSLVSGALGVAIPKVALKYRSLRNAKKPTASPTLPNRPKKRPSKKPPPPPPSNSGSNSSSNNSPSSRAKPAANGGKAPRNAAARSPASSQRNAAAQRPASSQRNAAAGARNNALPPYYEDVYAALQPAQEAARKAVLEKKRKAREARARQSPR